MTDIPAIHGVHHSAFRCRDAEETRVFYEDVLGLKLVAALDFDRLPGVDKEYPYMHLFFEMADGNFVAFFDVPGDVDEGMFKDKWGMDLHFAMEVKTMAEIDAFKERLTAHGISHFGPIDHDFCHSIYFYDPNGLNVEITVKDKDHDQILAHEAATAHDNLQKWTARTRAQKEAANLKLAS